MARKARKNIKAALARASGEVSDLARGGEKYAAGLSAEGYAGGYTQALRDVQLVMNGVKPNTRDYWQDFEYDAE